MDELGALLRVLEAIRAHLDLGAQATWFVRHEGGTVLQLLTAFGFQTVDPTRPGLPLTQVGVVRRYEPLVQLAADGGLTAVLTFGFYKIMWVRSSSMLNPVGLRQLLPRACLAALLINFALPLVQAAIDCSNALCAGIELATQFTAVDFLLNNLETEFLTPGLKQVVEAVLFASYVLLAFSYVVRFALLVVLTVLAPAAALLVVLPDTQHWAHHWGTLFISALLSQPLQLLILAVGAGLDAYSNLPLNHIFALAAVFICFKVPGALHSSSTIGSRASTLARRRVRGLLKTMARA
jgi:hypothetical protein